MTASRPSQLLLALLMLSVGLGSAACALLPTIPVGDAAAGALKFDQACAACHAPIGVAPFADLITNDMGLVNPAMNGVLLTDLEVLDLRAFLATQ